MQSKQPKGPCPLWPVLKKLFFLALLQGIFLSGSTGLAFAATALTIKLPKLPRTVIPVSVSVRTIEAETSRVLSGVYLNKKTKKVKLSVESVPQIVFVDLFTSDGGTLTGNSRVLRLLGLKKMTIALQLAAPASLPLSEKTNFPGGLFSPVADANWPPVGIDLVGVPRSGFTGGVPGLSARSIADMVMTDLIQATCHDEAGGFTLVETNPDFLASRMAEIELSNSTWADPSTSLKDLYVPPSKFINGNLSSDGPNMEMTMQLVDSGGHELLSKSATGPLDSFFDIYNQVMNELASAMCQPKNGWTGSTTSTMLVVAEDVYAYTEANVTFSLKSDPNPFVQVYEVETGSVTWSLSGTSGGCIWNAGPVTLPLTPENGELVIDTETQPNSYYGWGNVVGETTYTVTCPGSDPITLPWFIGASWFNAPDSSTQFLSQDGNVIAGEYSDGAGSSTWHFERQGP